MDLNIIFNGWVETIKSFKTIKFIILRNGLEKIEILIPSLMSPLNREDYISCQYIKKKSDKSLTGFDNVCIKYSILNKSYPKSLPFEIGLKNKASKEVLLKNKVFSLKEPYYNFIIRVRSRVIFHLHFISQKLKFINITTPKIMGFGSEGGSEIFKVKYYNKIGFLAQSPQLYKQLSMITGLNKVYEIGPVFRAEKFCTNKHLSEITSFDMELITDKETILFKILEKIIRYTYKKIYSEFSPEFEKFNIEKYIFSKKDFKVYGFNECKKILKGLSVENINMYDFSSLEEKALGSYFNCFYIIKNWPLDSKPFYIKRGKKYSKGFDLMSRTKELVSGGLREYLYDNVVNNLKLKNINPSSFEKFLINFKYGIPAHGGFAIGVERLIMELLNVDEIRFCTLFYRDPMNLKP